MADSFLLSQPFVQKIRSTIERVDGTPLPGAGGVKRGPLLEDPGTTAPALAKIFRIATFDGAWTKGSSKTVTLQTPAADGSLTPSNTTVTATNLFMDLGNANTTDSKCAIAKAGAAWFLVEAEVEAEVEADAECAEVFTPSESAENLMLLSGLTATGQVVSALSGSVVTGVSCVNGDLVVTTTDVQSLAVLSNLSDLVSAQSVNITIDDIPGISPQNVTLPPQSGCN